jgi:hypothetical protein
MGVFGTWKARLRSFRLVSFLDVMGELAAVVSIICGACYFDRTFP